MRITLLVNQDLASTLALNHLLPAIAGHQLQILMSARVGKPNSNRPSALQELAFVEQGVLNNLIIANTAADLKTIPALASHYEADHRIENALNQPNALEALARWKPDLMVSIRYGVILRTAALKIPRLGTINLHSGLLPDYRGVMATFWAMLNGAETIGTTLHYIDDASIDTGRIIGHTRLSVDRHRSYLDHVIDLYPDGCNLIASTISTLAAGKPIATIPQASVGNYHTFPTSTDIRHFAENGFRLYDPEATLYIYQRFMSP